MKRLLKMAGLVLSFVLVLSLLTPAEVSAASTAQKAVAAYQKFLKEKYEITDTTTFCLVYIDNNSVPELVVGNKNIPHVSVPDVYCYASGKVRKMKNAGSDYGRFVYSYKKGLTVCSTWVNGYGSIESYVKWSKSNTKRSTYKKYTVDVRKSKERYYIGKKKVSKKSFEKSVKATQKKYPIRTIYGNEMFPATAANIAKLAPDTYKSLVLKGKK